MIKNEFGFGMINMIIIIPILIISAFVLGMTSTFTNFTNDNIINNQVCTKPKEAECYTAKVFTTLANTGLLICILTMLLLLISYCDAEILKTCSKSKSLFKSIRCQRIFINYSNMLIVLLPIILAFQIIGFSTETNNTGTENIQEGFVMYIISFLLVLMALLFHPFVNKSM